MLAAYTDLAILYVQKGVKTAIEFAKELGEDINEFIQEAWDKANSEPVEEIVVYHGTKNNFEEFDAAFLGENTKANSAKAGFLCYK